MDFYIAALAVNRAGILMQFVMAGDFNHANLKAVLPKFHQHVKCAARGANTFDRVNSNIKKGYRVIPLPHPARFDHLSLLLFRHTPPSGKAAVAGLL